MALGGIRIEVGGEHPYPVLVGSALLDHVAELVPRDARRVAVLSVSPVADYAEVVCGALTRSGRVVVRVPVPDGEAGKRIEVAQLCWDALAAAEFTRTDVVIGVGGGATTDLAGFVAACWLRGVTVIQVPTTLLGMVDAAVGGKTGVNLTAGKNLVGVFHAPAAVLCDLDVLVSLPARDQAAGLAEVAKCGFIADLAILPVLRDGTADGAMPTGDRLVELIERSIRVKASAVAADLRDAGQREFLNYGHTLGHAVEQHERYRWRHGDAISVGMVYAAQLAQLAGMLTVAEVDQHVSVLGDRLGLPTTYPGYAFDALLSAMRLDKKSRGERLRFVVLDGLGHPTILDNPPEDLLRAAYDRIRA